jgi:uncharacterized protein YggU (UPF0235/DUF167 family)
VSVLEWLLIIEVVLLIAAGFFWGISLLVSGKNPDDPLSIFWHTFWKVFLKKRRAQFKVAVASLEVEKARQYEQLKQHGDIDAIKELLRDEMEGEEVDDRELAAMLEADAAQRGVELPAMEGEIASAPNVAQINVKVVPFAERDELLNMSKDGITIQVTSAAEEGSANKSVIHLVCGALGVKPYQITLLKGHYRSRKVLQVAGLAQEAVDEKLANFS